MISKKITSDDSLWIFLKVSTIRCRKEFPHLEISSIEDLTIPLSDRVGVENTNFFFNRDLGEI